MAVDVGPALAVEPGGRVGDVSGKLVSALVGVALGAGEDGGSVGELEGATIGWEGVASVDLAGEGDPELVEIG